MSTENIQEIFQRYLNQRDDREVIELVTYRKSFVEIGIQTESIDKMLMILEHEWEVFEHLKMKVKAAKSNAVMGFAVTIPGGFIASWVYHTEGSDIFWKYFLIFGTIASFIYGLKSINDIKGAKVDSEKRKEDWPMFERINEDLSGKMIKNIETNYQIQAVILNTYNGSYQLVTPGLIIPILNPVFKTDESNIDVKEKTIINSQFNTNSTTIELSDGGCLLHSFSFLNEDGQPIWELIHLDEEKYQEYKRNTGQH